jgi:hypothetical protein
MSVPNGSEYTPPDHTAAADDAAKHWPHLSEREINRLRFLAYRRDAGLIRPAAPVRPEIDILCADLLAGLARPALEPAQRPVVRTEVSPPSLRSELTGQPAPSLSGIIAARGAPRTWMIWATRYGTLRPDRAGRRSDADAN